MLCVTISCEISVLFSHLNANTYGFVKVGKLKPLYVTIAGFMQIFISRNCKNTRDYSLSNGHYSYEVKTTLQI